VTKFGVISGLPPRRPTLTAVASSMQNTKTHSLFCFSLTRPAGYEVELLKWQFQHQASIFGCDDYDIYSNRTVNIGLGVDTQVISSDLMSVYDGRTDTVLNAWVFIAVWKKVTSGGRYQAHAWTVKVDPDTVFFPSRLRTVVRQHPNAAYISNCKYGMHGPLEVLSRRAVATLATDYQASYDGESPKQCVRKQHFGEDSEDVFLEECLGQVLNLMPVATDSRLLCDSHCECSDWYWCKNGTDRVSFHAFKSVDAYKTCMASSLEMAMLPR